ncbi:MAG: cytochrome c [Burkholderiales bacterium]
MPCLAHAESPQAAQLINLLDYIAVEYPEFVDQGRVLDAFEYAEQIEFSERIASGIASLPESPSRDGIREAARRLAQLIETKAEGGRVASLAREIQRDLVSAYGIAVAPAFAPDLADASALYQAGCASCHGILGEGNGQQAAGLEPKPTNFRDRARQAQGTVFGYYNTITHGVEGTAMAGFQNLAADERWALAFYLTGFASDTALVARGRQLWNAPSRPAEFTTLAAVTTTTPADAAAAGPEAAAVFAYLRSEPTALGAAPADPDEQASTGNDFPREFLVILAVAVAVLILVYRRALSRRRDRSANP